MAKPRTPAAAERMCAKSVGSGDLGDVPSAEARALCATTNATTKSTTGPIARNASCSRTIAINAAQIPSANVPLAYQVRRTCSQTVMNSATANAEHACENGGATYM